MAAWSFFLSLVPLCKMGVMAGALVAILEHKVTFRMEAMLCGWRDFMKERRSLRYCVYCGVAIYEPRMAIFDSFLRK